MIYKTLNGNDQNLSAGSLSRPCPQSKIASHSKVLDQAFLGASEATCLLENGF